jgi:hypothetical protein
MRIVATGFGAGAAELDALPNCTQVVVGESLAEAPRPGQPVMLLETNVDDATGEVLAHAVESILGAGAYDAWITPILMKKGRPGHTVSVLVDPVLTETVRATLAGETGSLGVRGVLLERWPATRVMDQIDVGGAPVRVKVSPGRVKVEQGDAARVASRSGLPLRDVLYRAETVWRQRGEETDVPDRSSPDIPPDGPTPA